MDNKDNIAPAPSPPDGRRRTDAPDSGEIEWAGGFIPNPPAPGEARAAPIEGAEDDPDRIGGQKDDSDVPRR